MNWNTNESSGPMDEETKAMINQVIDPRHQVKLYTFSNVSAGLPEIWFDKEAACTLRSVLDFVEYNFNRAFIPYGLGLRLRLITDDEDRPRIHFQIQGVSPFTAWRTGILKFSWRWHREKRLPVIPFERVS